MSTPIAWTKVSDAPLYQEHLLLGATYDEDEPLLAAPHTYGSPDEERVAPFEGCALADLSGMLALLVSGPGCDAFVAASCATAPLAVGSCAFSAILTGDGTVASAPLVGRTGDEEYLIWDPTERGVALEAWLSFLAGIEQEGFRPYEGVRVEDVSGSLVPLVLWGPQAPAVIGDYVERVDALPGAGEVRNVRLDRIECLVACPPDVSQPCYLLFVPPFAARALWRSLLSFPVVLPVGTQGMAHAIRQELPWFEPLHGPGEDSLDAHALLESLLVRPEGGFIGARALFA